MCATCAQQDPAKNNTKKAHKEATGLVVTEKWGGDKPWSKRKREKANLTL